MTWNSFARETLTVVVALAVVASVAATPAAATQDDGGLLDGDDDGDEGGLLSNTTDALTDTLDSTTDGATDPVTDTVDSTVSTTDGAVESVTDGTTDGATEPVSSVTETVGAGDVSAPTDASQLVPVTEGLAGAVGDESLSTGAASTDSLPISSVPTGSLPLGSLPLGSLPTGALPADSLPADSLPAGPGELPTGIEALDGTRVSEDDLPADPSTVLEPVNETLPTGNDAPVQPGDSPYGSNGTGLNDACALPADEQDLPLEAVPGPGELPVRPSLPGVPVDLLTPEDVASIALAVPPRPCEVYDPHDPGFDPTEPPTDPQGYYYHRNVDVNAGEIDWFADSESALSEGGPGHDAIWRVKVTRERVAIAERFDVSDGKTSEYLGLDSHTGGNLTAGTGHSRFTAKVFGKQVGAGLACDASDAGNVSLDEPARGCDYSLDGVITPPMGPGDLVDTIRDPPSDPPIDGLPPVGSLPDNANEIIRL